MVMRLPEVATRNPFLRTNATLRAGLFNRVNANRLIFITQPK